MIKNMFPGIHGTDSICVIAHPKLTLFSFELCPVQPLMSQELSFSSITPDL
jgi:hypothetical protein